MKNILMTFNSLIHDFLIYFLIFNLSCAQWKKIKMDMNVGKMNTNIIK